MFSLAPIALFVYNRPIHTHEVLNALKENVLSKDSLIYVFIDGLKENALESDRIQRQELLKIISSITWSKDCFVIESKVNKGLEKSIIDGINYVFLRHETIIVLEDDIIPSMNYLEYMNKNLVLFKPSQNIFAICGFMFPIDSNINKNILLPFFFSWGWATWKEKWFLYERIKDVNIFQNHFIKNRFNLADYQYSSMIEDKSSWAIHWYNTIFNYNGLCVFPSKSLVLNIGNEKSGTHSVNPYLKAMDHKNEISIQMEDKIDLTILSLLYNYFSNNKQNKWNLLKCFLKEFFRR